MTKIKVLSSQCENNELGEKMKPKDQIEYTFSFIY